MGLSGNACELKLIQKAREVRLRERLVMCPMKEKGDCTEDRVQTVTDGFEEDELVISSYFNNLEVNNLDLKRQLHISTWRF